MSKRKIKVERGHETKPTQIRLKGKWLERAVFKPDSHVEITVENGKLTIESKP